MADEDTNLSLMSSPHLLPRNGDADNFRFSSVDFSAIFDPLDVNSQDGLNTSQQQNMYNQEYGSLLEPNMNHEETEMLINLFHSAVDRSRSDSLGNPIVDNSVPGSGADDSDEYQKLVEGLLGSVGEAKKNKRKRTDSLNATTMDCEVEHGEMSDGEGSPPCVKLVLCMTSCEPNRNGGKTNQEGLHLTNSTAELGLGDVDFSLRDVLSMQASSNALHFLVPIPEGSDPKHIEHITERFKVEPLPKTKGRNIRVPKKNKPHIFDQFLKELKLSPTDAKIFKLQVKNKLYVKLAEHLKATLPAGHKELNKEDLAEEHPEKMQSSEDKWSYLITGISTQNIMEKLEYGEIKYDTLIKTGEIEYDTLIKTQNIKDFVKLKVYLLEVLLARQRQSKDLPEEHQKRMQSPEDKWSYIITGVSTKEMVEKIKVGAINYDTLIKIENKKKKKDFVKVKCCQQLLIALLRDRVNEWTQPASVVQVRGKKYAKFRIWNNNATLKFNFLFEYRKEKTGEIVRTNKIQVHESKQSLFRASKMCKHHFRDEKMLQYDKHLYKDLYECLEKNFQTGGKNPKPIKTSLGGIPYGDPYGLEYLTNLFYTLFPNVFRCDKNKKKIEKYIKRMQA
eukprot:g4992.t1